MTNDMEKPKSTTEFSDTRSGDMRLNSIDILTLSHYFCQTIQYRFQFIKGEDFG